MKFFSRLLLCALVSLTVLPLVNAQKRFCPVPPPSPFKHDGRIVTKLDSAAHGIRTTLEHPRALGKGLDAVYLSASFIHQDPRRPAPLVAELTLISTSAAYKYRDTHNLVFLFDGKQRPLTSTASYQAGGDGQGGVLEAVRVTLSYEDLVALTRSKRVEARLGGTDLELTNNHLEALREFVSLMAPSPGRWRAEE